jgi:FAD/FMN-containing dehydrogenase
VAELTDEAIDITIDHALQIESPHTVISIFQLGGAVARVSENETAFTGRGATHSLNIGGITATSDGFEEERDWARDLWSALEPYHTSIYVNFLMDEGGERIRHAYGDVKYERLTALKGCYDPDNVFHLNQNIPPG